MLRVNGARLSGREKEAGGAENERSESGGCLQEVLRSRNYISPGAARASSFIGTSALGRSSLVLA
jgi:hypothetical protein